MISYSRVGNLWIVRLSTVIGDVSTSELAFSAYLVKASQLRLSTTYLDL